MAEFWRRYLSSRGLGDFCLAGEAGVVNMVKSCGAETAPLGGARSLLDVVLARRMLADNPFDRPDCFEILDCLDGKLVVEAGE